MKISTDGYSVRDMYFWAEFNANNNASEEKAEKIVQQTLEKGIDLNQGNENGDTPLIKAVKNAYFGFIKALIKHGADLESQSTNRRTALVFAVEYLRIEIIEYLINVGANVNPSTDVSPLIQSIYGAYQSTEILLRAGANIEHRGDSGMTALMHAASYGNISSLSLLIHQKANLEIVGSRGHSALFFAASKSNFECIAALLDAGAIWYDVDNRYTKPAVVEFILKHQAIKTAEQIALSLGIDHKRTPKVRI